MRFFTKIFSCIILIGAPLLLPVHASAQIEFTQNKGQWNSSVNYRGDFSTGSFFLEKKGFTVMLHKPEDLAALAERMHSHNHGDNNTGGGSTANKIKEPSNNNKPIVVHSFAYKVKFLGAAENAPRVAEKALNSYNNYFIGDRSNWASSCKIYQEVTYKNIYPNIDIRYYTSGEKMKYDFIVRPGGNVNAIAMQYDGPKSIGVKEKELVITTPFGDVKELSPYSYQTSIDKRQEIDCKYIVRDNVVTFQVKNYDLTKTLVIDPSIVFSSFTGSSADNWGYAATPGPDGSLFAGGIVFSTGYPVSPGAFDITYGGGLPEGQDARGYDMGIFKFSANGSNRLYATYIGGGGNEQPHSMICDAQGNLTIAGRTNSPTTGTNSYPVFPANNFVGDCGEYDIVITKLNAAGTALIGSVRVGGTGNDGVNINPKYEDADGAKSLRRNYGDDARSEVILDGTNNIYLASCTQSTDFPVRNSTIQTTSGGGQDGVILKFNSSLTTPLFSTYFGGNGDDACFVAGLNPQTGNLYIAGGTASTNLPGNTAGVIQSAFQGGTADGFVTQLRNDGSALLKTTYLGTPEIDIIYGLKFDRSGFPYVMGTTTGAWRVLNATYSNPGSKQFISKLQPDLSAYVYSTVFGTASNDPNISPIAFLVDRCENVYVSGWGGGLNNSQRYSTGNTFNLPEVNPLAGRFAPDGNDFYFFVMEKNAQSCLFASIFGQSGGLGDHVDGGTSRFDENGVIYQAICANCSAGTFPVTAGVWGPRNRSTGCNQAVVKIAMNFAGVSANIKTSINGIANDTVACIPFTVNFRDSLLLAKKYIWDYGDGTKRDTTYKPQNTSSHQYTTAGTFRVMLIAEDSSTCNIRDTVYINIKAGNNKVNLSFTSVKLPPCQSLTMQYTNTSAPLFPTFGPRTFVWDYGDGSPRDTVGYTPPRVHSYAQAGTYKVTLFLIDETFCNAPDTIEKTIRIDAFVKAIFATDALGCAPYTASFNNNSQAGVTWQWQFDNGTTFSTAENPTYTFNTPGTYRVRLIATDLNTCNLRDTSAYFTINVLPKPIARATWSPNPPQENVPVQFGNQSSQGAIRWLWNFGDGQSSTLFEPKHEYNATGTYDAELIAYNQAGCTDTFPLRVRVIVLPLLDVPNAFTPGRFGENGIVKVRGFGITKMIWRIYNRWGQIIFESTNKDNGWDGTYKGKLQPLDVYTYTLDAEFSDGKKTRKTGDITLLR